MTSRLQAVRDCYRAYETGERELIERCLSDDLIFFSPPDPGLNRTQYFERCWPGAGRLDRYEFKRMFDSGEEVFVTYECTRTDGSRFRNTEIFTLNGENQISRVEVYFGWDL